MFLEGNSMCFDFSIHQFHLLFKIDRELLHEIIKSMKGITIRILMACIFFLLCAALCVFVFDRILLTCGDDYYTEALWDKIKILLILGGNPITITIIWPLWHKVPFGQFWLMFQSQHFLKLEIWITSMDCNRAASEIGPKLQCKIWIWQFHGCNRITGIIPNIKCLPRGKVTMNLK